MNGIDQQTATPIMSERNPDDEHLKLLAAFHWVGAAFSVLGLLFVFVHFLLMRSLILHPHSMGKATNPPPPEFMNVMVAIYVLMVLTLVGFAVLNVLSGFFLRGKKHRGFSLFVAAANCIHVPLGTVLGVFTIIVLIRPSVVAAYERMKSGNT